MARSTRLVAVGHAVLGHRLAQGTKAVAMALGYFLRTSTFPAQAVSLQDPRGPAVRCNSTRRKLATYRGMVVVAPGNRDFPGGVQFERWLGGDTADDPNATKLLEDLAYGRVSAKEFVDRAHPVARRLREKYESAR